MLQIRKTVLVLFMLELSALTEISCRWRLATFVAVFCVTENGITSVTLGCDYSVSWHSNFDRARVSHSYPDTIII